MIISKSITLTSWIFLMLSVLLIIHFLTNKDIIIQSTLILFNSIYLWLLVLYCSIISTMLNNIPYSAHFFTIFLIISVCRLVSFFHVQYVNIFILNCRMDTQTNFSYICSCLKVPRVKSLFIFKISICCYSNSISPALFCYRIPMILTYKILTLWLCPFPD